MSNSRFLDLNNQVMENIGYRPLSNRIKPVHIANGLFREILQEEYSLDAINIWAKRFKKGKEINSAAYIKENFTSSLDEDISYDEINELRGYIEMLLDADKAVTPDLKYTTLTIANKSHVGSEVQNEFKIPQFLYKILNTKVNDEVSPTLEVIKNLLNDETDEISRFISPLTSTINSKKKNSTTLSEGDLSGIELQIREGFDLLVENSIHTTNKLAFLQRITAYGCFAILFHLSSKLLDFEKKETVANRIPLVIDANSGNETIKIASQESLLLVRLTIETYYEKVLEIELSDNYNFSNADDVFSHIDEFSFPDKSKGKSSTTELDPHDEMKNLFSGYYNQSNNLIESYARAIRITMFSRVINTSDPATSYVALGTKIGFLFGRTKKRFMPTPEVLEIVLLTLLKKGESLTLSELGEKMWETYGILLGANPEEDFKRLKEWKISEHVPGDLHSSLSLNAEDVSETYISMGYAKRYADGVIIFSL